MIFSRLDPRDRAECARENNKELIAEPWTGKKERATKRSDRLVGRSIDWFFHGVWLQPLLPVAGGSDSLLWPEASQKFSPVIETNSIGIQSGRLMALYIRSLKSPPRHRLICFFSSFQRLEIGPCFIIWRKVCVRASFIINSVCTTKYGTTVTLRSSLARCKTQDENNAFIRGRRKDEKGTSLDRQERIVENKTRRIHVTCETREVIKIRSAGINQQSTSPLARPILISRVVLVRGRGREISTKTKKIPSKRVNSAVAKLPRFIRKSLVCDAGRPRGGREGILEPGGISSTPLTLRFFNLFFVAYLFLFLSEFSHSTWKLVFRNYAMLSSRWSRILLNSHRETFSSLDDSIWRSSVSYCHFWIPIINVSAAASTGTLLFDSCFTRHFYFRCRSTEDIFVADKRQ